MNAKDIYKKQTIIVDGDIEAVITKIVQYPTYIGLIEGFPNVNSNNDILNEVKSKRNFSNYIDDSVFLIEPKRTQFADWLFGKKEKLPIVTCIIEVECYDTFRDKTKAMSVLGIVWFQEDYAFPIDADILEKIKEIPFRKICKETESD